jgi:inosine-uridine nucleoside N-ribohydrolase
MKKRFLLIIILISVLCLIVIGATSFAANDFNINKDPEHQHTVLQEPLFMADKDVQGVTFKSKEEILKMINENRPKNIKYSVESVIMKTYKEYQAEDDGSNTLTNYVIDPDRTVWVVKEYRPDGVDTKGGFYDKATIISVYDGQTGQVLENIVKGIRNTENNYLYNWLKRDYDERHKNDK